MISSRRQFLRVAGVALVSVGTARVASAHARLIRSRPRAGEVIEGALKTVDLWFNELLEEEFNTVKIYPVKELAEKKHASLATPKAKIDTKDRTHLVFPLPELEPGTYAVEYRVLSRDGHTAPGRFTFTFQPKP